MPTFSNIADFITCFQAMLNSRLGVNMIYLPVSLLSKNDAFTDFTTSIIINAQDFVRSYNSAVSELVKTKKINRRDTIRLLSIESLTGLIELPFWLVSPEGRRTSLYAKSNKTNEIKISTASVELGNLSSACRGDRTEQLKNILNQLGYRLRPKAVSLTLFVRLFLGDWFVHGVGGAVYEYITGHILEDYYGIKGLNFGVATATVTLPVPDCTDSTPETITELKQQLRSLKYNPEKFIEASLCKKEPVKSLTETKNKRLRTAKNRNLPAEVKRSAWRSIS